MSIDNKEDTIKNLHSSTNVSTGPPTAKMNKSDSQLQQQSELALRMHKAQVIDNKIGSDAFRPIQKLNHIFGASTHLQKIVDHHLKDEDDNSASLNENGIGNNSTILNEDNNTKESLNILDSNGDHYEFGYHGLAKKFLGDNSEIINRESRLSHSEMKKLEHLNLNFSKKSHVDHWALRKRNEQYPHCVNNEHQHGKYSAGAPFFGTPCNGEIQKILDEKNEKKTKFWTDAMLTGFIDPLRLSSAVLDDENTLFKNSLLLPFLSFHVTDITNNDELITRKFRIHLEYGVGTRCLRWDVSKSSKELEELHRKLTLRERLDVKGSNKSKNKLLNLPEFPTHSRKKSKIPKAFSKNKENDKRSNLPEPSELASIDSKEKSSRRLKRMSTAFQNFRNHSQKPIQNLNSSLIESNVKYLNDIQNYLNIAITKINFKDPASKIFQFFELSPFSLLLNNEITSKKKEGYMYIVSSASKQGWRVSHFRFHDLGEMVKRHTPKWIILGDSFIAYTSDISSTTPEEVFLMDSKFKMKLLGDVESYEDKPENDEDMEENVNENGILIGANKDFILDNPKSKLPFLGNYFSIKLINSERKLSIAATNPKITKFWFTAIKKVMDENEYVGTHRFGSFAPIRKNAFAQWFVDARDYMFAASSAIEMAKDVIYIHDWWLSPELYLRRPANGNQDWRIDRLLKRKAQQGVKIFIIIYRNVGNTVVTDSLYTKHSLLDLENNIYVLRSPNQIMQNVFFWAHHEKLLIIDNSVCFLGGIDLCFGRWDTPDHVLVDDGSYSYSAQKINTTINTNVPLSSSSSSDKQNNIIKESHKMYSNIENSPMASINSENNSNFHMFPGKDYSNPRKKDFFELSAPYKDMYDRNIVPRMPWHDIHMVTGGQVARDLARHFVQRWNYLMRQKRPSRPTPLLLPPRPFTDEELQKLNLTGTCEVQLLRSSGEWSLGLIEHEQSIHDAYIKCIEQSEHFIYIENQFFVTSCEVDGTWVKNAIGDALVDRIITAHKRGQTWKAIIVIPLMPGFEADVDSKEGGSVRLIMQCQYMSISMGETSIYSRLKRVGIKPEEYIQFYSLRKWGMIGPKKLLTTEQLYIHAKCMIVDDRIAIIGSANINERSMRGNRDSEVAAIIRDKHFIESKMDGVSYKVAHFAHTLRMRLMREHMGVDVDLLDLVERRFTEIEKFAGTELGLKASVYSDCNLHLSAMVEIGTRYLLDEWGGTQEFKNENKLTKNFNEELKLKLLNSFTDIQNEASTENLDAIQYACSFNHRAGGANKGLRNNKTLSSDHRVTTDNHRSDVRGDGIDGYNSKFFVEAKLGLNNFLKECINNMDGSIGDKIKNETLLPEHESVLNVLAQYKVEEGKIDKLNLLRWIMIKRLFYMRKLYSKAIIELKTENATCDFVEESNNQTSETSVLKLSDEEISYMEKNSMPHIEDSFTDPWGFEDPLDFDFFEGKWIPQALKNTMIYQMVFHCQPDNSVLTWRDYKRFEDLKSAFMINQTISRGDLQSQIPVPFKKSELEKDDSTGDNFDFKNEDYDGKEELDYKRLKRRAKLAELSRYHRDINNRGLVGDAVYDYETAKKLLGLIRGNLVVFPTKWLKQEVEGGNWFYKADKIPPIQIYN